MKNIELICLFGSSALLLLSGIICLLIFYYPQLPFIEFIDNKFLIEYIIISPTLIGDMIARVVFGLVFIILALFYIVIYFKKREFLNKNRYSCPFFFLIALLIMILGAMTAGLLSYVVAILKIIDEMVKD